MKQVKMAGFSKKVTKQLQANLVAELLKPAPLDPWEKRMIAQVKKRVIKGLK